MYFSVYFLLLYFAKYSWVHDKFYTRMICPFELPEKIIKIKTIRVRSKWPSSGYGPFLETWKHIKFKVINSETHSCKRFLPVFAHHIQLQHGITLVTFSQRIEQNFGNINNVNLQTKNYSFTFVYVCSKKQQLFFVFLLVCQITWSKRLKSISVKNIYSTLIF